MKKTGTEICPKPVGFGFFFFLNFLFNKCLSSDFGVFFWDPSFPMGIPELPRKDVTPGDRAGSGDHNSTGFIAGNVDVNCQNPKLLSVTLVP